jgi:thioredoxin reductase
VEEPFVLKLVNNERATARSVVFASGARYRRLAVRNLEQFEGSNVHYWASPLEAKLYAEQEVALVGGGNSAGQAEECSTGPKDFSAGSALAQRRCLTPTKRARPPACP